MSEINPRKTTSELRPRAGRRRERYQDTKVLVSVTFKKKKKKVWRRSSQTEEFSTVSKALSRQNLAGHSGSLVPETCAGLLFKEGYTVIVWTGFEVVFFFSSQDACPKIRNHFLLRGSLD